jgi:gliding motility-associated-like protein
MKWYSDAHFSKLIIQANSFETAKLKKDTAFYVEALSVNGCATKDTVRITVYDVPMKDLAVCHDERATIAAPTINVTSLTWYRNPDYSDVITNTASFETTQLRSDTTFYLETVSTKGCTAKNTIKVNVNHLPELTVRDTSVCAETAATLTVASNAVMLKWYNKPTGGNPLAQSLSYTTNLFADTVFYIEAFSNEKCRIRDSINISVIQPPRVMAINDRHLCYGEEVTLDVLDAEGSISWNVNPLTFKPQSTRQYIVTARRPPCPDVHDSVTLTVGDSLYISPPLLPPYQPYSSYSLYLTANAEAPEHTIIKGSLPSGLSLYQTGELSGIPNGNDSVSIFTVQVKDRHNCTASREYIMKKDFYIPKIFTPNGDGINDVFMTGHEVIIFDRLGTQIFKGNNGWDGTFNNKFTLSDIYFYILNRRLENGEIKTYSGYVGIQ